MWPVWPIKWGPMKFSRLRITGFKTFVEATEFFIEPGLTGIVGPNGCGKSNLVEALRWVMGESSFKNMRASGMDDVIFSGSATRPARNTAEVLLTVDNRDRSAPAVFNAHDTLEISRRLEREAGSTYRVNGREVRARDVQLLFADASTGARSPALVRQGQIGEIVNAKPQARRRVLEEAAGVAGLHARRHEAETRLKGAEQNLLRLEDVLAQIESQLDSLKRQARHAIRYRGLSADIRKAEAIVALARHREALAAVAEAKGALAEEQKNLEQKTLEQAEAAKLQAVAAYHLPKLRDEAAAAGAALQKLLLAREQLDGDERRAKERLSELERRIVQLQQDIAHEEALGADAGTELARLAAEEETLRGQMAESDGLDQKAAAHLQSCEAILADHERAFTQATASLAETMARRSQCERQIREASERVQRLDGQLATCLSEQQTLQASSDHAAERDRLVKALEAAQTRLREGEAASLAAEQALAAARSQENEARRPLAEGERHLQRLETEIKTLAKLLNVAQPGSWLPVVDQITVNKGYETALGAALGDDLDAPLDSASPLFWAGADGRDDPPLPDGIACLAAHVQAPAALARRLNQIGLVARTEGARLMAQLKPGQRLVSLEGDLWRWDGLTASAHAPTAAARRLAERNRLTDLEKELDGARSAVTAQKAALDAASRAVAQAAEADRAAREVWRLATRQIDQLRDDLAKAEKAASQIASRLSALAEALARLTTDRDEALARKQEAIAAFEAEANPAPLEASLVHIRSDVAQARADLAEARAVHQGLLRDMQARLARIEAIARDRQGWVERNRKAADHIATLRQRKDEAMAEKAEVDAAPDQFMERRHALIDAISAAEAERKTRTDRLVEGETAQAETDRMARQALDVMSAAREALARAEARLESADQRQSEIAQGIEDQFETPVAGLSRIAGLEGDDALPDLRETETELDKLKRERERLGGVNLRADSELEETQTRFDTMVKERDDLVEAIKKLRAAIASLNREGRERLLASFNIVNANFQRLFSDLFGGGTAELQLIESDDPLEAGLDILARPPGKKPQTLSLLSGGEQALTAIALIFAVFLTNPAPVCVLDEVDAPLDDANVERYCNLISKVAQETGTRFIVITHNPITMSRMDRLFGVTMVERGMSQLVSVDLDDAALMAAE